MNPILLIRDFCSKEHREVDPGDGGWVDHEFDGPPTPRPLGPSVKRKTEMNYAKFISVVPFYFSRAASFA